MEFEGRTEQEAVERASAALSISRSELDYTVIDEGSGGIFGLGARPVRIRARGQSGGAGAPSSGSTPAAVSSGSAPAAVSSVSAPAAVSRGQEMEDAEEMVGGIVGPAPEKAAHALEVAKALTERMQMRSEVSVRDEDREIVVVLAEAEGAQDVVEMLGSSRPPGVPSFQFLLNKIVNRFPDNRKHIVVEAPSVSQRVAERRSQASSTPRPARAQQPRQEQEEPMTPAPLPEDVDPQLAEVARQLADRAKQLGKVITIHPMSSADRRAVHLTVMTLQGVETVSEGEGLYRRIHIIPASLRPQADGAGKRRRRRRRRGGRRGDEGGASVPQHEAGESEAPADEDSPSA